MSCCGGKRRQFPAAPRPAHTGTIPVPAARQTTPAITEVITFEYTGRTGLTVRGPLTGRAYRFAYPGAQVSVDKRDASALTAVPHLKRSKTSG
jgi:hypothetical protein